LQPFTNIYFKQKKFLRIHPFTKNDGQKIMAFDNPRNILCQNESLDLEDDKWKIDHNWFEI